MLSLQNSLHLSLSLDSPRFHLFPHSILVSTKHYNSAHVLIIIHSSVDQPTDLFSQPQRSTFQDALSPSNFIFRRYSVYRILYISLCLSTVQDLSVPTHHFSFLRNTMTSLTFMILSHSSFGQPNKSVQLSPT
jgi:hypothetical protein